MTPIVISPLRTAIVPKKRTMPVASMLMNSTIGGNALESATAHRFAFRLPRLIRSKRCWLTSSRAKAWTTRTPETFSWKPAATSPIVSRVRR